MVKSKLPSTGTSIFTVMSALSNECGAINLAQGFPDFPVSEKLVERVHYYMKAGKNQYAPMPGTPELRNQIAEVVIDTYDRPTDPAEEITVFAGGTEALFATFTSLIHPGDEVIVFDPAYDSYDPVIRLAGAQPVHIRLNPPSFHIPWDEVRAKINSRTSAIVINTPHNPTGSIISADDLMNLEQVAEQNDLYIISDEVYERILFPGNTHHSVLRSETLRKRAVAIFSFGKTFHATGWKIGYAVACPEITTELRKVHQFVTFTVNTPIQLAMADHMKNPENYLHLGQFFHRKQKLFSSALDGSIFEPLDCFGTYFQMVRLRETLDISDHEFAEKMTREDGVAAIPVSAFYEDGYNAGLLRFCFAKGEETLLKAAEILQKVTI